MCAFMSLLWINNNKFNGRVINVIVWLSSVSYWTHRIVLYITFFHVHHSCTCKLFETFVWKMLLLLSTFIYNQMLSAILMSSVSSLNLVQHLFGLDTDLNLKVLSQLLSVLIYIIQLLVNVVVVSAQPQTRRCREKCRQNKNQRSACLWLQYSV